MISIKKWMGTTAVTNKDLTSSKPISWLLSFQARMSWTSHLETVLRSICWLWWALVFSALLTIRALLGSCLDMDMKSYKKVPAQKLKPSSESEVVTSVWKSGLLLLAMVRVAPEGQQRTPGLPCLFSFMLLVFFVLLFFYTELLIMPAFYCRLARSAAQSPRPPG